MFADESGHQLDALRILKDSTTTPRDRSSVSSPTKVRFSSPAITWRMPYTAESRRSTWRKATMLCTSCTPRRPSLSVARHSPARPSRRAGSRCPVARGGCGRGRESYGRVQRGADRNATLIETLFRLRQGGAHEIGHEDATPCVSVLSHGHSAGEYHRTSDAIHCSICVRSIGSGRAPFSSR